MSERQEYWSFIIPWAGGSIASWGDLSMAGVAWCVLVFIVSYAIHGRISRSAPAATNQTEDAA